MMPIAIVGRAGIFPQSPNLETLWDNVFHCRDMTSTVPSERWRLDTHRVLGHSADGTWSDRGGYVPKQQWSVDGLNLTSEEQAGLGELQRWVLHTAHQAVCDGANIRRERTGLILGNLSFPSSEMSAYVESSWYPSHPMGDLPHEPHPHHRFMSGRPALLARKALGLGGAAWALLVFNFTHKLRHTRYL